MTSEEITYKSHLAQLANNIREKYNAYKRSESEYQRKMERQYQPLLVRAKASSKAVSSTTTTDFACEDQIYGLKVNKDGNFHLGKFPITINDTTINVSGKTFPRTAGLISLLTRNIPRGYDERDLEAYRQMLLHTGAHLTEKGDRFRYCRGDKYHTIIKRLMAIIAIPSIPSPPSSSSMVQNTPPSSFISSPQCITSTPLSLISSMTGNDDDIQEKHKKSKRRKRRRVASKGVAENENTVNEPISIGHGFPPLPSIYGPRMKIINTSRGLAHSQYSYWDDPNELVERLILLHASKAAGNTSVHNEILNIEEELREAGIIQ